MQVPANVHLLQAFCSCNIPGGTRILGVLPRFRKDQCAIIAKIEQMIYGFYVKPEHKDYL